MDKKESSWYKTKMKRETNKEARENETDKEKEFWFLLIWKKEKNKFKTKSRWIWKQDEKMVRYFFFWLRVNYFCKEKSEIFWLYVLW